MFEDKDYEILNGHASDVLKTVEDKSVRCCVTSPPYWGLRDYDHENQIGGEESPEKFVESLVDVFSEVHRVLTDDGTFWLNIGDSYASYRDSKMTSQTMSKGNARSMRTTGGANNRNPRILRKAGIKHKELCGIPWKLAFALQKFGWYLRQDIIWHKENPMPESVRDRCTRSHEYLFLLTKKDKYFYNNEAIKEEALDGSRKNKRDVWTTQTSKFRGGHFATFPKTLIEPCILAGSEEGDIVLDPFNGSATTGIVALNQKRKYIGCELNPDYIEIAEKRIAEEVLTNTLF